ncbi:hypothetical protein PENTCL1PPCAC_27330, partial [Pristionchus entomophagus]
GTRESLHECASSAWFSREACNFVVQMVEAKISDETTERAADSFQYLLSSIKHKGVSEIRKVWTMQWRALKAVINDPSTSPDLLDRLIEVLFSSITELGKDALSREEMEEIGRMIYSFLQGVKNVRDEDGKNNKEIFKMHPESFDKVGQLLCALIETVGAPVCSIIQPLLSNFFSIGESSGLDSDSKFWVSCATRSRRRYNTSSRSIVTLLQWILKDAKDEELKRTTEEKSEEEGEWREDLVDNELLGKIALLFEYAEVKDGDAIPLIFSLIDKCEDKEWAKDKDKEDKVCARGSWNNHRKVPQTTNSRWLISSSKRSRMKTRRVEFRVASQFISSLSSMIDRPDSRSTDDSILATENAIFSITKIITICDVDQNTVNKKKNELILGVGKVNRPKILRILYEAINNDDTFDYTPESVFVKERLVSIIEEIQ